jgi:hypothetical protein
MMELTTEQIQSIWAVADKMEKASIKVDKLYSVIVGDKELQQEGILTRLEQVEKTLEEMDRLIIKTKGYIAGSLFVGSIAGSIITILIKSIFKI